MHAEGKGLVRLFVSGGSRAPRSQSLHRGLNGKTLQKEKFKEKEKPLERIRIRGKEDNTNSDQGENRVLGASKSWSSFKPGKGPGAFEKVMNTARLPRTEKSHNSMGAREKVSLER